MPEFVLPAEDEEARLHRVVVAAGLEAVRIVVKKS